MLCRSMKKDDILKDFQKGKGFPWLPSVFLKLASYLSLGIFYLWACISCFMHSSSEGSHLIVYRQTWGENG